MEMIDEVIMFLNGKEDKLIEIIEEKMKASDNLDFENATNIGSNKLLKYYIGKQKIVSSI